MSMPVKIRPRSKRRDYLTRTDREQLHERMTAIADEHRPLTLRQLYYLLVSEDVIEKTQAGYRRVMRQLKVLRHAGRLPWGWVVDTSRAFYGGESYEGLSDFLTQSARLYRRDLWANVQGRAEIWCESDSIAGPIFRVAREWGVRVYPVSGFSSDGFAYEAAEEMAARGRPTFIYYFGDFDPSGESIGRNVEAKLRAGLEEFGGDPESLHFERTALTLEQIRELSLPSRPPKRSDPRTKAWGRHGTVEIEALPPDVLRGLVEGCILRHLDLDAVQRERRIEEAEQETLAQFAESA